MQQYLSATAEVERDQTEADTVADDTPDDRPGGTGQRATGSEGSMGNPTSTNTNGTYGIEGPRHNQDVHVAKRAAYDMASTFGLIGVLNSGVGGDPNAPTAIWGRDTSLGNDPMSARGNMWGDSIMDAAGAGGLGLSGNR